RATGGLKILWLHGIGTLMRVGRCPADENRHSCSRKCSIEPGDCVRQAALQFSRFPATRDSKNAPFGVFDRDTPNLSLTCSHLRFASRPGRRNHRPAHGWDGLVTSVVSGKLKAPSMASDATPRWNHCSRT